jgi:hypothetical protein
MRRRACWLATALIAVAGCAAGNRPATDESAAPVASRTRTFEFATEPAASAPAAEVDAGVSEAGALLSKESVRQVIRDRYTEIRACYEKELKKKPNLHGTVTARFMISEDGSVASVDMASSKLPSAPAVECVGEIFKTMKFPPPPNGMILITYPIQLMPEVTTDWQ